MVRKSASDAVIRPKRQVTIPKDVCEQLGLKTGDKLEFFVENSVIVARPRKNKALDSLQEIRQAFQRSGVTEEELIAEGRKVRESLAGERFGAGT